MRPAGCAASACVGRDDRAVVLEYAQGLVLAVVDGAGGVGRGSEAADGFVARTRDAGWLADATAWADHLRRLDGSIAPAQAAAAVVAVTGLTLFGASVGDCQAWWFGGEHARELTREQRRKPLLGDGGTPEPFTSEVGAGGVLVIASDGLWKYARWRDVESAVTLAPDEAARRLVASVRLPSGGFQDDVGVVVCRVPGGERRTSAERDAPASGVTGRRATRTRRSRAT